LISTRPVFLALAAAVLLVTITGTARSQAVLVYDPLPQPLKLPPGLVETLPLNKTNSFFGEAIRAIDCQNDNDLPYGTCGEQYFGGLVMGDSHLNGNIQIQFSAPVENVSHFQVIHSVLMGDDSVIKAPQGYELPLLRAQIADVPGLISEGDLDLITGGVTNLQYNLFFSDSAIDALFATNPNLQHPVVSFPGIRGHAWAKFEQRADGLLDFSFRGSTFYPLGKAAGGELIRFPLPFCGPDGECASFLSRGAAFHPHLYLSTREPDGPECGDQCPDIPENTIEEFTISTQSSSFGDDFNIDNPGLGGVGRARSQLLGRLEIQFGPRCGDTIPFVIRATVPEGLLAELPPNPRFGPGFLPGLLGQDEYLKFPLVTYHLQRIALVDEPFNIQHGAVNLKTGRVIGEMEYPAFFSTNVALVLFDQNAPRIPKDPFYLTALRPPPGEVAQTYALFEKGSDGETIFRFSGVFHPTFVNFLFPSPDFVKAHAFLGGPDAVLHIFLRLQAMHTENTPRGRITGGATDLTSALGDNFSYTFSTPCDGADNFSFQYTNHNSGPSGGTFIMQRLAAVNCIRSRRSTLPSGEYDTVSFSGFGTWSADAADAPPRFATVQVSTGAAAPYVGILVFQNPDAQGNVVLSSADTRPVQNVLP